MTAAGRLFGIGVGPGDPELLTLKGLRLLRAADTVAFPILDARPAFTRKIVSAFLQEAQKELPLPVPLVRAGANDGTDGRDDRPARERAYAEAAAALEKELASGRTVALLCEGDPFFYGSFLHLHEHLAGRWPIEVIPGVSSVMAAAATLGRPLARGNAPLTVLPAMLERQELRARLLSGGNFAIIKPNRNWPALVALLDELGLRRSARLVVHASLPDERRYDLAREVPEQVPYFSLLLVSGA